MNRSSDNGLTTDQLAAARHPARLLSIVAGPGTGKTRVAAYRFGLLRFDSRDLREVVAVSFTRSAAAELRDRIETLWGSAAVVWPHSVSTLDDFYRRLIGHLLAEGAIRLPGRQKQFEVRDAWTEEEGWSSGAGFWRFELHGRDIVVDRIDQETRAGFLSVHAAQVQLDAAQWTHSDVRHILTCAVKDEVLCRHVVRYLRDCVKAVLVDEVYDGNHTEVAFMTLVAQAGLQLTLIGDPRQVIYGFRGALPEAIEKAAGDLGMRSLPLTESHRFGPAVKPVTEALRHRRPLAISLAESRPAIDAVLSPEWSRLWKVGEDVMPLRRGKVVTVADAALHMLIDACAVRGTGLRGACLSDAVRILGRPATLMERDPEPEELGGLLDEVEDNLTRDDAAVLLVRVAELVTGDGRHRSAITQGKPTNNHMRCMKDLATRWKRGPGNLLPGFSIHQAKGREWDRVAVCVTDGERERLRRGLSQADGSSWVEDSNRLLYVGMTRARELLALVTAQTSGEVRWYQVSAE